MSRQVVLDTETTGFEWQAGNRIVEIGCVELLQRRPSGRIFHRYLNPDRASEPGALRVHGLSEQFLADQPRFADIVDEFLAFIDGAELIIHNAAFDVGFLDHELNLLAAGHAPIRERCAVLDTQLLARERFPGQRVALDVLCRRLGVDNSHRSLHGALIDAQLLAEVYLQMTGGQGDLGFADVLAPSPDRALPANVAVARRVQRARPDEVSAHRQRLAEIARASGGRCRWPGEGEG